MWRQGKGERRKGKVVAAEERRKENWEYKKHVLPRILTTGRCVCEYSDFMLLVIGDDDDHGDCAQSSARCKFNVMMAVATAATAGAAGAVGDVGDDYD